MSEGTGSPLGLDTLLSVYMTNLGPLPAFAPFALVAFTPALLAPAPFAPAAPLAAGTATEAALVTEAALGTATEAALATEATLAIEAAFGAAS